MSDSVLARHSQISFVEFSPLSSTQTQVDGLVTRFNDEASNPITLASLVVGSGMYRFARIGTMASLEGRLAAPIVRSLSFGTGLFAEAASFQLTDRGLRVGFEGADARILQFGGSNGLGMGTLQSMITFGSLRGAGHLAEGQTLVFQHALQATTIVGGHHLSAAIGLTSRPEGTLGEQLLSAEVTNLQLMAGMGLVHSLSGGRLSAYEQALDLNLRSREGGIEGFRLPALASMKSEPELAMAGPEVRMISTLDGILPESRANIMHSQGKEMGSDGSREPSVSDNASARDASSHPDRAMEALRQFILKARGSDKAEKLNDEDFRELQRLAEHFREHPDELTAVLKGMKEAVEEADVEQALSPVVRELRNPKRSPERNADVARQLLETMPLNRATFMSGRHIVPNAITVAAAVCAAVSIVEASGGHHEMAALLLPIAAVLDKLDGGVARAMKASHPIGASLDSYADFAAYGVASAYFARAVLESHGETLLGNTVGAIIFSHALLRLAVFDFLGNNSHVLSTHDVLGNPISKDRSDFVGMPSTMVGLYMGLIYAAFGKGNPDLFFASSVTAGMAMFWPLRYVKFGNNFRNDQDNPWRLPMTLVNVLGPTSVGGALAAAHGEPRYFLYGLLAGAMSYVVSPFLERGALALNRWRKSGNPTDPSGTTAALPNPNVRLPAQLVADSPDESSSDRSRDGHVRVEAATSDEGQSSKQGSPDQQQDQSRGFAEPSSDEDEGDVPAVVRSNRKE
jgi:phosphatidylserine synthase